MITDEREIKAVLEGCYAELDSARKFRNEGLTQMPLADNEAERDRASEDAWYAEGWRRWYSGYIVALEWILGRTNGPPVDPIYPTEI